MIAGVDEAGRGPLAGPVVAAAVILDPSSAIPGLTDSKVLSAQRRRAFEIQIKQQALAWSVAQASVEEIDALNILQASLLAMRRAVLALSIQPKQVWVDGNQTPELPMPVVAIVKGDLTEPCISAASILAKQDRDRTMQVLDTQYPGYGFAQHSGYPTKAHIAALQRLGPAPVHRKTFGPVKRLVAARVS